jgi:thioredoxin reductase (NADPH)
MSGQLRVLSRCWCHLCDDLLDELMAMAVACDVSILVEDVDARPELEAQWGELVPVLLTGAGERLCHYHLDAHAVHAHLGQFPLESTD